MKRNVAANILLFSAPISIVLVALPLDGPFVFIGLLAGLFFFAAASSVAKCPKCNANLFMRDDYLYTPWASKKCYDCGHVLSDDPATEQVTWKDLNFLRRLF